VIATNALVLATAPGNPGHVTGLADLARPDLLVGLCSADVPCVALALQPLADAQVAPSSDTLELNVRALATKLSLGELDAGLIYTTDAVVADLKFAGLLFESLVVRDLRIHGQASGCELSHYRDGDGLEVDAIVRHPDGRWIAVEVKLGGEAAIEQAVRNLHRLRRRVDADHTGAPSRLVVITAGGHGYEHPGGVTVVPITNLGP